MGRAPDWQSAEERPVVVLGAGGMLARAVVDVLEEHERHYVALSERDLDITYEGRVAAILKGLWPRTVINAAGYTDVDGAEKEEELALAVNGQGAGNVARVCQGIGASLVHISTDYVFDGEQDEPYMPEDDVNPVNVYGTSKFEGERQVRSETEDHLIVRTSWLFGPGGKNFITTMLTLGARQQELKIVDDQTGSPTFTRHLAQALVKMSNLGARGIFHLANSGSCTWYELAKEIFRISGSDIKVIPITTKEYPTPAKRPKNSVLDCSNTYEIIGAPLPRWPEAVRDFIQEITAEGLPSTE